MIKIYVSVNHGMNNISIMVVESEEPIHAESTTMNMVKHRLDALQQEFNVAGKSSNIHFSSNMNPRNFGF